MLGAQKSDCGVFWPGFLTTFCRLLTTAFCSLCRCALLSPHTTTDNKHTTHIKPKPALTLLHNGATPWITNSTISNNNKTAMWDQEEERQNQEELVDSHATRTNENEAITIIHPRSINQATQPSDTTSLLSLFKPQKIQITQVISKYTAVLDTLHQYENTQCRLTFQFKHHDHEVSQSTHTCRASPSC